MIIINITLHLPNGYSIVIIPRQNENSTMNSRAITRVIQSISRIVEQKLLSGNSTMTISPNELSALTNAVDEKYKRHIEVWCFILFQLHTNGVSKATAIEAFRLSGITPELAYTIVYSTKYRIEFVWIKEILDRPGFYIMRTPVTNSMFRDWITAKRIQSPAWIQVYDVSLDSHPVTNINLYDAKSYAKWLEGRLPTDDEWTRAAQGIDQRKYPWGSDIPTPKHAQFKSTQTIPVGTLLSGASAYNVLDMAGNVWEWTVEGSLRGGSYCSSSCEQLECTSVLKAHTHHRGDDFGFRVVKDKIHE